VIQSGGLRHDRLPVKPNPEGWNGLTTGKPFGSETTRHSTQAISPGLIVRAPSKPHIVRCLTWLKTIQATGAVIIIPDIAHYEVRRELLRIRVAGSLRRLEYYHDPTGGLKHLPLTTDAIVNAAKSWAFLRQ
jgi:hypothetical protein